MKIRTLVIAVVLLAALSVAVFLRNRPAPAPAADPRVGGLVLDADTVSRAAGLSLSDQGKKVDLIRGADGAWRVASYYDLPADFEKVSRFVQDLHEAKVDRFVTASPDRLSRLEFKDSQVSLRDASGKDIWSVNLGKTADSGNGRFIRFGDEPRAFFSSLHVWLDTDPKVWADAQLVTAKPDDIAKMVIPLESGATVEVSRSKKDSPWAASAPPSGQKLIPDKVAALLTTLTSLRFSDTAEPNDPAAAVAAKYLRSYRLTTFDGKTITVALGRKPEEKKLKAPTADPAQAISLPAKGSDGKIESKPVTLEYDTTPAGPVFAVVASTDAKAPINDLMKRRSFKVDDYAFTGLPQKTDDLFEPTKSK